MKKIKMFLESVGRIWKWTNKSPRNAVVSVTLLILSVIGLYIFVTVVLPVLILLVFVVYVLSDVDLFKLFASNKKDDLKTLEDDAVREKVKLFLFDIISVHGEILKESCYLPKTINDLFDDSRELTTYNDAPLLNLNLLRKQKEMSGKDCDAFKPMLQSVTTARIRDGFLKGYDWAVNSVKDIPLIKIASVEVSQLHLNVGILLTNSASSVEAARLSDKPKNQLPADDKDPLFAEGSE